MSSEASGKALSIEELLIKAMSLTEFGLEIGFNFKEASVRGFLKKNRRDYDTYICRYSLRQALEDFINENSNGQDQLQADS